MGLEPKEVKGLRMASDVSFTRRPYGDVPRGGKRAIIKALMLTNPEATPSAILTMLRAQHPGFDSSEASIRSIRSDFLALKRALEGNADASKRSIDCLNLALISDPGIDRDRCRAILQSAGHSGFALSDGFIGPSLAASRESLAVIAAGGAYSASDSVPMGDYRDSGAIRTESGDPDTRPKPSNAVDWRLANAVDISNVRKFGEGQQHVYVYGYDFAPDRLKVGKAEGDVVRRIASQITTGSPGKPILYLIFQTDDCHNLEKALHRVLSFRQRKVAGGGDEWFHTNCGELIEIYKFCVGSASAMY
jgi:hypothetical protein